ncbi:swi5-dependent recombination DNA repair protein 1 homolog [Antennarius striatus]|uniref:swi5-dependent recombination DNA repair protein 1 homolog n=1 Tax=Antennarius striatus TaxID=241820 RepID=UPI0035AFE005
MFGTLFYLPSHHKFPSLSYVSPMELTPKECKSNSVCSSLRYSMESSPFENKEENRLSSSLKARLKRSRRFFIAPSSVAKRLCVEEDDQQVAANSHETVNNPVITRDVNVSRNETRSVSECVCETIAKPKNQSSTDSVHQRDQLRKEVKDKTETLRRLKMVKMYRSKNDLTQLQTLVDKWRSCAQAALYELQSEVPIHGRKASLSELIDLFGLDDANLHFDRTEDDFTS